MPKQSAKSGLAARIGKKAQEAFESHKDDATNFGNAGLPAGIEGGVAQLVDCHFGIYETGPNKGKDFFMAAGVVVEPVEFNGVSIAGLRTTIGPEPLADTPQAGGKRKTFDAHYSWMMNELSKLGVSRDEMDPDNLEAAVQALVDSQPYFRFRTWKGQKQASGPYKDREPAVRHEWSGACSYTPGEPVGEVEDGTGQEAEEPQAADSAGDDELLDLAQRADGDDDEAQRTMEERADAAGVAKRLVQKAENWAEVARLIAEAEGAGGDEQQDADEPEQAAEEPAAPAKGDVYRYRPPKAKKLVECEVTSVLAVKEQVTLKNLDDGTLYKGVAWADLKPVD